MIKIIIIIWSCFIMHWCRSAPCHSHIECLKYISGSEHYCRKEQTVLRACQWDDMNHDWEERRSILRIYFSKCHIVTQRDFFSRISNCKKMLPKVCFFKVAIEITKICGNTVFQPRNLLTCLVGIKPDCDRYLRISKQLL